jgi:hypothetical protein
MSSIINIAKTLAANEEKKNKLGGNVDRIASELVNSTAYKEYEVSKYDTDSKSFYDELNTFYKDVNEGAYKRGSDVSAILGKNNQMISATQSAMEYFKGKDDKTYKALESELANLNKIGTDLGEISKYYGGFTNEDEFEQNKQLGEFVSKAQTAMKTDKGTVAEAIREGGFDLITNKHAESDLKARKKAAEILGKDPDQEEYNSFLASGNISINNKGNAAITFLLAEEGFNTDELLEKIDPNGGGGTNNTIREALYKYGFTDKEITAYLSYWANVNESTDKQAYYDKLYADLGGEWWSNALISLVAMPVSVAGGVVAAADLISQNVAKGFNDKYIVSYDTYTQWGANTASELKSRISSAIEKKAGKTVSFLYDTGTSIGESAIAMLASAGVGKALGKASAVTTSSGKVADAARKAPWVSGVLLGSSAGVQTVQSYKAMGYTDSEALAMGIFAGTAESVFETLSLERLLGKTMEKLSAAALIESGKDRILKRAGAIMLQSLIEGSEEAATEIANFLSDTVYLGARSSVRALMEEKVAQGMSFHDAHRDVVLDKVAEAVLAGLGGAISGGVMGGGGAIYVSTAFKQQRNRNIKYIENTLSDNLATRSALLFNDIQNSGDRLIDSHKEAVAKAQTISEAKTELAKIITEADVTIETYNIMAKANDSLAESISDYLGIAVTAEDLRNNRNGIASIYAAHLYARGLTGAGRKAAVDKAIKNVEKFIEEETAKAEHNTYGKVMFASDIDQAKLTKMQKKSIEAFRYISDVLGTEIFVFDSNKQTKKVNGYLNRKNNTISIDINSGNNAEGVMLFTLAHELVHFIKSSPKNYKELEDFLTTHFDESLIKALEREQIALAESQGDTLTEEEAHEEVLADLASRMLANKKMLTDFAKLSGGNKNLIAKIRRFFKNTEGKLEEMYSDYEKANDRPEALVIHSESKGIVDAFSKAFEAALLNTAVEHRQNKADGKIGTVDIDSFKEAKDSNGDLVYAKKRLDNNAQGEYNANNNVEGDATNGREEASRKIGGQEVVRNDARRTGSDQESVSRKIKEILRKSTADRRNKSVEGRKSGRLEQAETAEAFEERVRNDGYQYVPIGVTAVAFKTAPKSKWNENARVAAEHLENLGVTVIVFDRDMLHNKNGVTGTSSHGVTVGTGDFLTVFISSELEIDGIETAYHEAFHALKRMNEGATRHHKMMKIISSGVNIDSKSFEDFVSEIAEIYSYKVSDVPFDRLAAEITEEFYAWYIGSVYATKNEHSMDIRSYIEDFSNATDVKAQLDAVFAEITNKNNNDIRFSRKATDSAYLDAVKRGDMETAQKMVDEAAKANGYDKLFYHGAKKGGGFTEFRDWSYFTENKQYAERYTERDNKDSLYTTYVKLENPFDTRNTGIRAIFDKIRQEYGLSEIQDTGLPDWTDGYDISDYIDENELDYDGIILDEGGDLVNGKPVSRGTSYVIRKSAQIKSADPVTYDDNGNIIPISERFNPENEDIRFSRKYTPEEARAAIERVMGEAEPQKPRVKQYQTTQGMIKKQLSDTTKDKKYSKHVVADIVKSFSGRELLKSKDITEIVQFLWEGLNDYSDSNYKGTFAKDMASFYVAKLVEEQKKLNADFSMEDNAEYKEYLENTLVAIESEILNAFETKGEDTYKHYIEDQLLREREKMTAINRITRLLDRFEHQSRANRADLIYTDIVNGLKPFKADLGKLITVDNVKAYAEKLDSFIDKVLFDPASVVVVDGKEGNEISFDAFDADKALISDEETRAIIKELKDIKVTAIGEGERDLTLDEYRKFNDVLGLVSRLTTAFGNEYIDGKWRSNEESVKSVVDSSTEAYNANKHIESLLKSPKTRTLKEQFDTPTDYINFIFGSREENIVNRYVNDIVKAADDMRAEYIKVIREFEEFLKKGKYFNRLYKDEVSICGEKITVGEFISLYCTAKREQSHAGLVSKATVFGSPNEKSTSKLPGKKLREVRLGESIEQVKANIDKAYQSLNDRDKDFIKLVERFFNKTSTDIKMACDLLYFGYTNALDESYYFPISRDTSGRDIASVYVGAISVVKQSFNHTINKKASGALRISNVFDVVTKHADGLMQYKHMFIPVQNFSKLFGKNIAPKGDNSLTILKMLEKKTGGSSVQYVRDWLANLQGKKTSGAKDITPFKSVLATTSLGLNIQSVAKQNASLWAMMVESPIQVNIAQLEGILPHVINEDKMTKYSSVAAYRRHDNAPYSAAVGKVSSDLKPKSGLATVSSEISDKSTSLLRWGDLKVTKTMWSACQRIVARKHNLKIGTEENLVAAGKLLDEMINKYNDTTSVALKPLAVRDGSWYSMFTMFASQPIKMWSALTRYSGDMQTAKLLGDKDALSKARGKFFKAALSVGLQAVWMGLIEAIIRDLKRKGVPKDEDEIILHVIGVSYVTEIIGIVPIIGDIINAGIETLAGMATYDIGGDAMSDYYNSLADLVKLAVQTTQKKGDLVEGRYQKVFELIASLCGVPVRNTYKYATILSGQIDQIFKKTSTYVVDYYYSGYAPTVKDLKNAAKKDSRYAETMLEILASKKLGSKDADSELSSYTIEELLRLYKAEIKKGDDGDLGFLLPPSVPKKFSKSEAKTYYATMEKAYSFANNLLDSARYKALDDEQRRDAISSVWSIYNDAAKVSATKSAASVPQAARYMIVTSGEKSAEIYVLANAYEKAYNNASKQERAKMKPVATYLSQLCREYGISNEQRVIIAAALGVGATKDIKNAVKKKAESKGITIITSDNE